MVVALLYAQVSPRYVQREGEPLFDGQCRRQESFAEAEVLPGAYLRSKPRPEPQLPGQMTDDRGRFFLKREEANNYERKLYVAGPLCTYDMYISLR